MNPQNKSTLNAFIVVVVILVLGLGGWWLVSRKNQSDLENQNIQGQADSSINGDTTTNTMVPSDNSNIVTEESPVDTVISNDYSPGEK